MDAPEDLEERLRGLTLRDEHQLRRRISADGVSEHLLRTLAAAEERVARRVAAVPRITYPQTLPVSLRRDDILAALRESQVVVVAGETGSGKTTQLPKMCLELGRGVRGTIGHTQPRRIAARAVAERVSEELGVELGGAIGYQVRFTDRSSDRTLVKVMTDGVLLAEIQRDRLLRQYDTLILDEAHERSLNIDFLLGFVTQLLPKRPDLKVVITSATIDTERFAAHFGGAPVVEVSGRTYPVEVRYRPPAEDVDQVQATCDAVLELQAEGPGDVLVFLSGEREIRDTAEALQRLDLPATEVLPLYARLSAAEQHRVFRPHAGRRVVLATNVAETSLTVPGIRYVVDPGTARISRYSARTKVQRLPIERISRASADQRKGRCGRVAEGVCIRLYDEEDYLSRPEFTDPEILRTNLASVILQMTAAELGDVASFPFVDPPDRRGIRDGLDLLDELGALASNEERTRQRLTPVGRQLAALPVDPRLGRMVVAAAAEGCVGDVVVVAAALSIQDPRERPSDKQQAADEMHARFRDPQSDFSSYLNLWRYLQERQSELSSSAFRRLCRAEFLHYLRVREWQDLHAQLRSSLRGAGIPGTGSGGDERALHRALLSGLLSHIGVRQGDTRDFLGARGARFAIAPGSALAKRPPRWVMAAELVETNRMWARTAARIEPEWVEPLAAHLVRREVSEPHWDADRGAVMAYERVTLSGVPIVARRRIGYAEVDPGVSREMFVRHALVEGDWQTSHGFVEDNRRLLDEGGPAEHRLRRREVVTEDTLFEHYDRLLPGSAVSARDFDAWWKTARRRTPDLLALRPRAAAEVDPHDFPDVWSVGTERLRLTYRFAPGEDDDGVTVDVPVALLNRVPAEAFSWQVPGYRAELVTALIRSLPKATRVRFVPAPDWARRALTEMTPYAGHLLDALEHALHRLSGAPVPHDEWRPDAVPPFLLMRFAAVDAAGAVVGASRDLAALRERLAPRVRRAVADVAPDVERTGLTRWDLGTLPRTVDRGAVRGYPALVDEGGSVAVRVLPSEADQAHEHPRGTRRLVLSVVGSPLKAVVGALPRDVKLGLASWPYGPVPHLLADTVDAVVDALVARAGGPVWDEAGFARLVDAVRPALLTETRDAVMRVGRVLAAWREVGERLDALTHPTAEPAVADMREQLAQLVFPGFVAAAGADRLPHLERYLTAMLRRIESLPREAARDAVRANQVRRMHGEWERAGRPDDVRWMLEELRVSLFAQSLGTAHPVSEKRILHSLHAGPR